MHECTYHRMKLMWVIGRQTTRAHSVSHSSLPLSPYLADAPLVHAHAHGPTLKGSRIFVAPISLHDQGTVSVVESLPSPAWKEGRSRLNHRATHRAYGDQAMMLSSSHFPETADLRACSRHSSGCLPFRDCWRSSDHCCRCRCFLRSQNLNHALQ